MRLTELKCVLDIQYWAKTRYHERNWFCDICGTSSTEKRLLASPQAQFCSIELVAKAALLCKLSLTPPHHRQSKDVADKRFISFRHSLKAVE